MNLLDLIVIAYIAWRSWRGYRRGFAKELPSTVSIAIFFFFGWGLFKIMYRGLSQANAALGNSVGILTFIGLVVASLILLRRIKAHVRRFGERIEDERRQKKYGAIAGGVRGFLIAAITLLVFAHGPVHAATRGFAESSLLGRVLIRFVLPVYAKTHDVL